MGRLPAGTIVEVLSGPVCNEGYVWFEVLLTEGRGWTVETPIGSGDYWLEPWYPNN